MSQTTSTLYVLAALLVEQKVWPEKFKLEQLQGIFDRPYLKKSE